MCGGFPGEAALEPVPPGGFAEGMPLPFSVDDAILLLLSLKMLFPGGATGKPSFQFFLVVFVVVIVPRSLTFYVVVR